MLSLNQIPHGCQVAATVVASILQDAGYKTRLLSSKYKGDRNWHVTVVWEMGGVTWEYDVNSGTLRVGPAKVYPITGPALAIGRQLCKKQYRKGVKAKWRTPVIIK